MGLGDRSGFRQSAGIRLPTHTRVQLPDSGCFKPLQVSGACLFLRFTFYFLTFQ